MKNHVTYETAIRLKEAGFPQPEPEAGQVWWGKKAAGNSEKGSICVLIGTERGALNFRPVNGVENENNKFFVFAPAAADILRELKCVVGEHIEVHMETYENEFVVRLFEDLPFGNFDTILETNDNPAEAAAQAFLNLKAE